MVLTKQLLENTLGFRLDNDEAVSELHLPKFARCIPVLSLCYMGKRPARVLRRSEVTYTFCAFSVHSFNRYSVEIGLYGQSFARLLHSNRVSYP